MPMSLNPEDSRTPSKMPKSMPEEVGGKPAAARPFAHMDDDDDDDDDTFNSHPSSTGNHLSEMEIAAVRELKEELANIPHEKKSSLAYVQRIQPDLVDDAHFLDFIRVEDFNIDLALKRLLRYWEHRYKIFGPKKFALPMTLSGAMRDHIDALKHGFLTILPVRDLAGRAIIYSNSSPYMKSNLRTDQKIPVWWYLLHVAMENPEVKKKGFIILANSREARLNNFDGEWSLAACFSGDRDFPIRWRMAHVCHANAVFPYVASAVKAFLSPKQRKSFILHNGSNDRVLESLSEYHLSANCIPVDLGGNIEVSTERFVQERMKIEAGASGGGEMNEATDSAGTIQVALPNETQQYKNEMQPNCNSQTNPQHFWFSKMPIESGGCLETASKKIEAESVKSQAINTGNMSRTQQPAKDPPVPMAVGGNATASKLPEEQTRKKEGFNIGNERKIKQTTKKAGRAKPKSHPGRIGDPRMNRAVQAKMDNPNLSLVAALVAGGFVFPDLEVPGLKLSTVKDTDNVTVYQRRNQLLRRLRLVKEKAAKS